MAFVGERYILALNGSFNGNEDLTEVPAGEFAKDSRNIDTHNGGAEKRGGTQKVGSQITASLSSLGGGQLVKRNGNKYLYWAGSNGTLYRDGASIATGRDASARANFTVMGDEMFIANGVDVVKVDDGSSIATISDPAADWSGSVQPKKFVLHAKGQSRRAFAFGVPGFENTLYYSVSGDFEDFANAGSGTVVFDFEDGYGITDCVSKDGALWVFGKNKTFVLDDSDSTPSNWGHFSASFKGGAHHERSTCVAGNYIYVINSEGNIYQVETAEQLRDYKEGSITYPAFIHNYIRETVDLSKLDQCHLNYEPRHRALMFFFVAQGSTTVGKALKYYIDLRKWAPPHDSDDNSDESGYSASASFQAETSAGAKRLYTHDYNGFIWELSSTTKTDDGNAYKSEAYSGWLSFDLEGVEKRYAYGILSYKSRGDYQVNIRWWVDDTEQSTQTVSLSASGATLGSFVLDTDVLGVIGVDESEFEMGQVGRKLRVAISNDGAGHDFFLSKLVFPFIVRGVRRL